jgi:hypothetical protein
VPCSRAKKTAFYLGTRWHSSIFSQFGDRPIVEGEAGLTIFSVSAILSAMRRGSARGRIMDLSKGTTIALAMTALLVASGCGSSSDPNTASKSEPIKCEGGNACSGLSECATADGKSLCSGENECKGTGYVYTATQEQCTALQIRNKP